MALEPLAKIIEQDKNTTQVSKNSTLSLGDIRKYFPKLEDLMRYSKQKLDHLGIGKMSPRKLNELKQIYDKGDIIYNLGLSKHPVLKELIGNGNYNLKTKEESVEIEEEENPLGQTDWNF